jgi:hypothetical protein
MDVTLTVTKESPVSVVTLTALRTCWFAYTAETNRFT